MDAASENDRRDAPQTLGATLAAERERQGLSRAEVAQRLHMSPSQVEALERADYEQLPKGTFLRGFVRNYAKVLGIAADSVLALLDQAAPQAPAPRIVVPTQNIRFDPLGERFSSPYVKAATLAVVAVAIAFAAMYWAMYVRPKPPAPRPAANAQPAAPGVPLPPAASAPPPTAPQSLAPQSRSAPPAAPEKASVASAKPEASKAAPSGFASAKPEPAKPTPSGAAKVMRFHFEGESWVEVRDARGKVLLQRLNAAGTDAEVSGRPPFAVVVGNAPGVRMSYNGRDFPLEPHTDVAVARFTLE